MIGPPVPFGTGGPIAISPLSRFCRIKIDGAALAVVEGDGGSLDVFHILSLQLRRFVFREYGTPPTSNLII